MRIHLLDMGMTKYGDCLLLEKGDRKILIDGGHPGDFASIRNQLSSLFGHGSPFEVDLLIVTHCHSDHIGCLPSLVSSGALVVRAALVADERFGWGRDADGNSPVDAISLSQTQLQLLEAFQEEDLSDATLPELAQFFSDETLEDKYAAMLEAFTDAGVPVVRYGRDEDARVADLEASFTDFGLKVLGPTRDHLVLCAAGIAAGSDSIASKLRDSSDANATTDLATTFKRLATQWKSDAAFAADQPGVGAAKNDQSIVIKVASDGWAALLGGDMQFAKPEVPGLAESMQALRETIVAAGPYQFVKLTHHTSYNGLDESVLDQWITGGPKLLLAHTGGRNDSHHPDEGALELLQGRVSDIEFARTDRNGIITVEKQGNHLHLKISKGSLNNFSPNSTDAPVAEQEPEEATTVFETTNDDIPVEVSAKVKHRGAKVTITIEVEPSSTIAKKKAIKLETSRVNLPVGHKSSRSVSGTRDRTLPKLLFVTNPTLLSKNVGSRASGELLSAVRALGTLLELAGQSSSEQAREVSRLVAQGKHEGVVLLGGYDVVSPERLDVLDGATRRNIERAGFAGQDVDDFVVWSDDVYGDTDGDRLPEVPVSRIPDASSVDLVQKMLGATQFSAGQRFGVRNIHREFAVPVFREFVPGESRDIEVSETFAPSDLDSRVVAGAIYFMLHGSSSDATRFWGEKRNGVAYEAVSIAKLPARLSGAIVFTGCCWGGLTVNTPAVSANDRTHLRARTPDDSIALAFLRAGAMAFVGCTGSHYSPVVPPFNYFGAPMHTEFWQQIRRGVAPAKALFLAKKEYARQLPHGRTDPFSRAVEVKILRQYTCLGLGW